jgi:hypothetical protein
MSESLPPTVEPTAEACACCAEPEAAEREALDREALPLHAACRLDPKGQRQQRDRYRAIGKHLDRLEREPERLTAWLGTEVDLALVQETIDVERDCCPFYEIGFDSSERRLSLSVASPDQDPALDAIRFALTGSVEKRSACSSKWVSIPATSTRRERTAAGAEPSELMRSARLGAVGPQHQFACSRPPLQA